jgi:hypothetical protein
MHAMALNVATVQQIHHAGPSHMAQAVVQLHQMINGVVLYHSRTWNQGAEGTFWLGAYAQQN